MRRIPLPKETDFGTIELNGETISVSILPERRAPHEQLVLEHVMQQLTQLGVGDWDVLAANVASRLPAKLSDDGTAIVVGDVEDVVSAMLDDPSTRHWFADKTKPSERREQEREQAAREEFLRRTGDRDSVESAARRRSPVDGLSLARDRADAERSSSSPQRRVRATYPDGMRDSDRLAAARQIDTAVAPKTAPGSRPTLDAPYPGTTDPVNRLANARTRAGATR
ncbi:MAG: hypothetical protein AAGF47_05600 [Planctomycetota bacterium]